MLDNKEDVFILAIESSCDETAAAVVKNGREVLSNIIYSQIALHTVYGGVVPEIASRKHIEKINQVIEQALIEADKKLEDMTAIAVTYGPGLVGALWSGFPPPKLSASHRGFPWLAYIISRGTFVQIILKIRNWSRLLYALWYPAGIPIWW